MPRPPRRISKKPWAVKWPPITTSARSTAVATWARYTRKKPLDHLLTAARNGQNSADFAIAQLFSQGKGTKPDPLNAYVFSQLAKAQDTPEANDLATPARSAADACATRRRPTPGATGTCCPRTLAQSTLQLHALQEEDGEESL